MAENKTDITLEFASKARELVALLKERDRILRESLELANQEIAKTIEDEVNRNNAALTSLVDLERITQDNAAVRKSYKLLQDIVDKNSNSLESFSVALGNKPQVESLFKKFISFWKACAKSIALIFTSPKIDLSNLDKQNNDLKTTLDSFIAGHPKQRDERKLSAEISGEPSTILSQDAPLPPIQPIAEFASSPIQPSLSEEAFLAPTPAPPPPYLPPSNSDQIPSTLSQDAPLPPIQPITEFAPSPIQPSLSEEEFLVSAPVITRQASSIPHQSTEEFESSLYKQNNDAKVTLDSSIGDDHPKQGDEQELSAENLDKLHTSLLQDAPPLPPQPIAESEEMYAAPSPAPPLPAQPIAESEKIYAAPPPAPPLPPLPQSNPGQIPSAPSPFSPLFSRVDINEKESPAPRLQSPEQSAFLASIQKGKKLKNADNRQLDQKIKNDLASQITSRRNAVAGDDNEDDEERAHLPKKLTARDELLEASRKEEAWQIARKAIEEEKVKAIINMPFQEPKIDKGEDPAMNQVSLGGIPKAPPLPPPPPPAQDKPKQSYATRTEAKPKVAQLSHRIAGSKPENFSAAMDRTITKNAIPSKDSDIQKYGFATKFDNQVDALSKALAKGRVSLLDDLLNPDGKSQLPKDLDKFVEAVTKAANTKLAEMKEWDESPNSSAIDKFKAVPIEKWKEIQSAKASVIGLGGR